MVCGIEQGPADVRVRLNRFCHTLE